MAEVIKEIEGINGLHQLYPNRNIGLRTTAKVCFESGKTVAREASAGHSNGLDEHAIGRQRQYIQKARDMVERLYNRPIPDRPGTNPMQTAINFQEEYVYFTVDIAGEQIPINEAAQELAENWLICAVELAVSQSAAIAGSLVEYDYQRAMNNLSVIEELVDEIESRPQIDLPETAHPGSNYGTRTTASGKSK